MSYFVTAFGVASGLAVAKLIGLQFDYESFSFGAISALISHWAFPLKSKNVKGELTEGK